MDQGRCRGRRNNVTATTPGGAYVKSNRFAILLSILAVLSFWGAAIAHHSFAAEFDCGETRNAQRHRREVGDDEPSRMDHSGCYRAGRRRVRWMVETSNPNGLMRLGWTKNSLKPGDADHGRGIQGQGRIEHSKRRAGHSGGWTQRVRGFFLYPRATPGAGPGKVRRR